MRVYRQLYTVSEMHFGMKKRYNVHASLLLKVINAIFERNGFKVLSIDPKGSSLCYYQPECSNDYSSSRRFYFATHDTRISCLSQLNAITLCSLYWPCTFQNISSILRFNLALFLFLIGRNSKRCHNMGPLNSPIGRKRKVHGKETGLNDSHLGHISEQWALDFRHVLLK